MTETLLEISTWVVPILLAITLHEAAHGYAANAFGDPTAKNMGRLSLNPLRHIDLFGTIILPGLLLLTAPFTFGWAKPVPVQPGRLRNPHRDMIWVALAGPATNIVLALVAVASLHLIVAMPDSTSREWLGSTALNMVSLNVVLAVFNMIPIPPLDGGRVLVGVLPLPLAQKLAGFERKGMLILLFCLLILPMIGQQLGVNLSILSMIIGKPVSWLVQTMLLTWGP